MIWFIKRHFRNLKRSISWFLFMYKNQDWDYNFLYQVIEKKLKGMEKSIRCGQALGKQSRGRHIKICRWYLERIINGDVVDSLYDKHTEKYGNVEFHFKPYKNNPEYSEMLPSTYPKCKTKKENKYASKVSSRIHRLDMYYNQKYKERVFYILNKYIEYWWD